MSTAEHRKGGPGSGHYGHRGRPGQRGGSLAGGTSPPPEPPGDLARAEAEAELEVKIRGYRETQAADFIKRRDESVPEEYKPFVHPYTAQEYKTAQAIKEMGGKTYLSKSGRSGFTITRKGDIISVFSAPGAKEGLFAIEAAKTLGGTHLDCYDGKLAEIYQKHGFQEYDRWAWDDQYAPEGWDYTRFGRPDVVLMSLTGEPPGKESSSG